MTNQKLPGPTTLSELQIELEQIAVATVLDHFAAFNPEDTAALLADLVVRMEAVRLPTPPSSAPGTP